jgi:hypothetical protein
MDSLRSAAAAATAGYGLRWFMADAVMTDGWKQHMQQ